MNDIQHLFLDHSVTKLAALFLALETKTSIYPIHGQFTGYFVSHARRGYLEKTIRMDMITILSGFTKPLKIWQEKTERRGKILPSVVWKINCQT